MSTEEMNSRDEHEIKTGQRRARFAVPSQGKCKGKRSDTGFPFKTCPEPVGLAHLERQEIRILLVVDGGITFGNESFGLSLFLDALHFYDPFISFKVTKANRRSFDETANYEGFRFDKDFDPDGYDEVWLFGADTDFTNKMRQEELKSLAKFMDGGGGVFATGDHEDLGAPLCGEVPRVRFMRKWFYKYPLPKGQPRAVPVNNEFRHDSLNRGNNSDYEYLDQVDDVPKMIFPKINARPGAVACLKGEPHPVLAYVAGAIRFLPDHVHEGECYAPEDLKSEFEFCAYRNYDFPAYPGSDKRVEPEVIAWAQIPDPHVTHLLVDCYPTGKVVSFGTVGAYKGQKVGVGNVVVDSSFHHFINFNLCGFVNSADKVSKDKGQYAYDQIKTYYRNIGMWLAREQTHIKVFNRALIIALHTYPLTEEVLTLREEINSDCLKLRDYFRLGVATRITLGSLASPALARDWSFSLSERLLLKNSPGALQTLLRTDLVDTADLLSGINTEVITDSLLGVLTSKLTKSLMNSSDASFKLTEIELGSLISTKASETIGVFSKLLHGYASHVNSLAEAFNQPPE